MMRVTTPPITGGRLRPALLVAALLLLGLLCVDPALAADASGAGSGLPWDKPLTVLRDSITGPVAFTISLVAIVACGAQLIWGGEVSEFSKRMIYLVMVICVIVFANTLLSGKMFSGAVVPEGGLAEAAAPPPLPAAVRSAGRSA